MGRSDQASLNTLEALLVGGDDETVVLIAGSTRFELERTEIAWIGDATPSGGPPPAHGVHVLVVLRGKPRFASCRRLVPPQMKVPFAIRAREGDTLAVRGDGYRTLEQEYLARFGLQRSDTDTDTDTYQR